MGRWGTCSERSTDKRVSGPSQSAAVYQAWRIALSRGWVGARRLPGYPLGGTHMRPTVFAVRRIAVAAVAVAAVAVAGPAMAQESHSASVASSKAVPPCQSSGIDDWLDTSGNGTAGTIFYHLEFTN